MDDPQTFFVRRRGLVQGPWDLARLRSEVKLQKLAGFHEVSADGVQWMRASDVVGLFPKEEKRKSLNRGQPSHGAPTVQVDVATSGAGEWYYFVDDNQVGPISLAELTDAVFIGRCPLDAVAWKESFGEQWLPIDQIPELMAAVDAPRTMRAGDEAGLTRYVDLAAQANPKALYALVAGVISLLFCWIPLVGFSGVVAVGLGGYTIYEIRKSGGRQSGMAQAAWGVALGAVSIVIAVLVLTGVAIAMLWNS